MFFKFISIDFLTQCGRKWKYFCLVLKIFLRWLHMEKLIGDWQLIVLLLYLFPSCGRSRRSYLSRSRVTIRRVMEWKVLLVKRGCWVLSNSVIPLTYSLRCRRPSLKGEDRPVASVRPVQSTPIPMMPRHVPLGSMGAASISNPAINFPINYLQRAGVLVQKIVTTTGQLLWQLHFLRKWDFTNSE